MRVLLDTNAYVALRLGEIAVAEQVQRSDKVLFSAIVAGELLFGFRNGSRFEENLHGLREFLAEHSVAVLPITWRTAEFFGRISADLRKRGTPIPSNDIWIASQAMEAGAGLLSGDRHFSEIEGLDWLDFSAR